MLLQCDLLLEWSHLEFESEDLLLLLSEDFEHDFLDTDFLCDFSDFLHFFIDFSDFLHFLTDLLIFLTFFGEWDDFLDDFECDDFLCDLGLDFFKHFFKDFFFLQLSDFFDFLLSEDLLILDKQHFFLGSLTFLIFLGADLIFFGADLTLLIGQHVGGISAVLARSS